MDHYCANCGTEVDDSAVFCPTCGQPIDQAAETAMPAAPAWPDEQPAARSEVRMTTVPPSTETGWTRPRAEDEPEDEPDREPDTTPDPVAAASAATAPASLPPGRAGSAPASETGGQSTSPPVNLPVTMPVTLSAWLIGGGAAVAALGAFIGLFGGSLNPIDLLLLLALIGITVTVFFSANVPAIPHLRLATFVVVLIGFGVALDRIGAGRAGIGELLLFLGSAAAAMGAILLELGRDQPLGGPAG